MKVGESELAIGFGEVRIRLSAFQLKGFKTNLRPSFIRSLRAVSGDNSGSVSPVRWARNLFQSGWKPPQ
jgi:hypothetical protein